MNNSKSKSILKSVIASWLLPLAVGVSISAFFLGRALGISLDLVVSASAIGTLLIAMLLERLLPFNAQWNRNNNDTGTDLSSSIVLLGVVDPLLKYLAPICAVALYNLFNVSNVYDSLVGQTPFWLQLLVATLAIEFLRYWIHRLHHIIGLLWYLHAMHHSSQRLYALNNFRFHPLNYALMFLLSSFPLLLAGAPADVLLGYLALSLPVIMLQHANIDLRNGVLNYLLSTNELHRWHHSSEAVEANANYGHALILWDQIFGTFKYQPNSNNMPEAVGLFPSSNQIYPANASYWLQLRSMFCCKCC